MPLGEVPMKSLLLLSVVLGLWLFACYDTKNPPPWGYPDYPPEPPFSVTSTEAGTRDAR